MDGEPRIYVSLPYYADEQALDTLQDIGQVDVREGYPRPSEEELRQLSAEYDILIIGVEEEMTDTVHQNAERLTVLGTVSAGLDHIHPAFHDDEDIAVVNTPNANTRSVGEFTVLLMLALLKRLVQATESVGDGGRKDLAATFDLRGRQVGIIGAGNIGTEVMELLHPFDCDIVYWDRSPKDDTDVIEQIGAEFADLDTLLHESDVVSIHLPLTEETRGLISEKEIGQMREEAILINTARAEIVDNQSLFEAVRDEEIGGAGIDATQDEIGCDIPDHPDILVTPHIAGISQEAIARMERSVAERVGEEADEMW